MAAHGCAAAGRAVARLAYLSVNSDEAPVGSWEAALVFDSASDVRSSLEACIARTHVS